MNTISYFFVYMNLHKELFFAISCLTPSGEDILAALEQGSFLEDKANKARCRGDNW